VDGKKWMAREDWLEKGSLETREGLSMLIG
jgi:hypothetical protein